MDYPKSVPSAGLANGKFVDEDQIAGAPGSLIPAQWGNAVTEEFLNVISSAGFSPDEDNNAQLLAAINAKIAAAVPSSPPDASATEKGLVELANVAETQAGKDTQRAITPAVLRVAYGLGDSILVSDLNDATTGYFYASPNASNNPGSTIVFGETRGSSGSVTKIQICMDVTTRIVYKRAYSGSSWTPWSFIVDSGAFASETTVGVAKVATQSLTNAGVDDATIVTPKKLRAGFSSLFAANGYVAFPSWLGGLIIQWGSVTRTGVGSISYNFPLTFPNAVFQAVVSNLDANGVADTGVPSLSTTQITISYDTSSAVAGVRYIAIGN
ncbi:hypothetical protein QZH45_07265 [Pseudomonas corrugata]|uniref:gp53-like domain-containing protein n=1 Tax=Pseudomonas corrugata TaxID=47879 RepID=UPI00087A90E4|nr:hypothetical protein [Pseudomonas corrugata]SDV03132.1 hypothetical protein SAMN04490183_3392 [Pseudomonas corrugata]